MTLLVWFDNNSDINAMFENNILGEVKIKDPLKIMKFKYVDDFLEVVTYYKKIYSNLRIEYRKW